MSQIAAIRKAIVDRMQECNIRVQSTLSDNGAVPSNGTLAMLALENVRYEETFGRLARFTFRVRLMTGKVSERNAQVRLDTLLSADGDGSLRVALSEPVMLETQQEATIRVIIAENLGIYQLGEADYFGGEVVLEVVA